jgi:hypothetical protein
MLGSGATAATEGVGGAVFTGVGVAGAGGASPQPAGRAGIIARATGARIFQKLRLRRLIGRR